MSDMFDKVTSQQDVIKKLFSKLPGFKGYVERSNRRTSDKIIRDTVASRFEGIWTRISALQRDLVHDGDLQSVGDLEAAAIKLRQFIDRVQKASYGYSGLFDAVKINETELNLLYQYDLSLLNLADEVSQAADNVETSIGTDGLKAAIRHLVSMADQCVQAFDKRHEVITGMDSTQ